MVNALEFGRKLLDPPEGGCRGLLYYTRILCFQEGVTLGFGFPIGPASFPCLLLHRIALQHFQMLLVLRRAIWITERGFDFGFLLREILFLGIELRLRRHRIRL